MALLFVPPPPAAGAEWAAPSWHVMPGPIAVFVGGNQPGYDKGVLRGQFTVTGAAPVTSC